MGEKSGRGAFSCRVVEQSRGVPVAVPVSSSGRADSYPVASGVVAMTGGRTGRPGPGRRWMGVACPGQRRVSVASARG